MAALLVGFPMLALAEIFVGKDSETTTETLTHGIKKITHTKKRKKWARCYLACTTLGLSELHLNHEETDVEYVYDGNYLGETRLEAAETARKMANDLVKNKNFSSAEIYFDIALELHPGSIDKKKEIEEEKNNALAEIAFEDGQQFLRGGNFNAAVTSLERALRLSTSGNRRTVFQEKCDNARAEILCQEGDTHFRNSDYTRAKQCFNNAIQLVVNTDRRRYFQTRSKNADSEILYNNAKNILRRANLTEEDYEVAKRDAVAASRGCSDNYTNKQKFLDCIEKVNAAEIFETGMTSLRQAWDHENCEEYEQARTEFERAHFLFKKAAGRFRNSKYEQYAAAVQFKISGNEEYAKGVQLFYEGHEYRNVNNKLAQQKYQEANDVFSNVIHLFRQGAAVDITNESHFQNCVRYVESMKEELKRAINNTELDAARPNSDQLEHSEVKNDANNLTILQTKD